MPAFSQEAVDQAQKVIQDRELLNLIIGRGWSVFPCTKDKRPETLNGYKDAVKDRTQIEKWLNGKPVALWGIPCAPNGIFAVDVDPEGFSTWQGWTKEHGSTDGPVQKTPRGGLHLIFNLPEKIRVPNNAGKLAPGIDLRSDGYICTGQGYTWQNAPDTPVKNAPGWLLQKISELTPKESHFIPGEYKPTDPTEAGAYWLNKALEKARPGNRNQTGFDLACQLRDSGISQSQAKAIIQNYAARVPGTDYTELEAVSSLKEAYNGPPRKPATLPKPQRIAPERVKTDIKPVISKPDIQPPEPEIMPLESTTANKTEAIKPKEIKQTWTVAELYDTEFPDIKWIIPDLIPSGLTILGGRPKVGKSWFMLQVAAAVSAGGKFFDKDIEKGAVLYIAFEDGPRRLKNRILKLDIPRDADIRFERNWKPLQSGGLNDLVIELTRKDYRLIVIDTLTRAIPGIDQDAAQVIGPITANLQNIATNRNIGIVLNDHLKKPNGFNSDPIDDILNSTAKTANADAILAIYKEKGKKGAALKGRGRDIEEIDMHIFWDRVTSCWQSEGNTGEIELTERQEEIIAFISEKGKSQAGYISKSIGQDYGNTYRRLQDMVTAGLIQSIVIDGKTYYAK